MHRNTMKILSKISSSIRYNILVGLVLVTPIVLTGFIISLLFNFVTNFLPKALKESDQALLFRLLALLAVLIVLFLIGVLVRNFIGRKLYKLSDRILTRIPGFNRIYLSIRQVSETLLAQKETLFKEVVLVEYPRKGLYSMGFITAEVPPSVVTHLNRPDLPPEWVAIFIPTSPNPTSGLFIMAPRSDVIPLPINVTEAMKLIISGGAVFPGQEVAGNSATLLEKMERILTDTPPDTAKKVPPAP